MKKRLFTIAAVIFMFSFGFAGCGKSNRNYSLPQSDTDVSNIDEQIESDMIISTESEELDSIFLPDMPFADTNAVIVDQNLITNLAQEYCNQAGDQASSAAFFLGYLRLVAADALGGSDLDADTVARHLGSLAVSGFFGGIWLRDALQDRDSARVLGELGISTLPIDGVEDDDITKVSPVFKLLSNLSGSAVSTALNGKDNVVLAAGRVSIPKFLILYGYNWGYFHYILENPPEGATVTDEYDAVCTRFLDCEPADVSLDTLMQFEDSLDKLYSDEGSEGVSEKWLKMKKIMDRWGVGAVNSGDLVWTLIMNDQMDPDVYELLLDLSDRFMVVAELCVLPAMKGYAENDPAASRVAILEQAGMIMWAGSYFMGLLSPVSNVPTGTFPELILED